MFSVLYVILSNIVINLLWFRLNKLTNRCQSALKSKARQNWLYLKFSLFFKIRASITQTTSSSPSLFNVFIALVYALKQEMTETVFSLDYLNQQLRSECLDG